MRLPWGRSALATPTDLSENGVKAIAAALNGLAADAFALYLTTKNFHWHMSGPHFRDYHLLLDEHGDQIDAMIDPLAERVRKLGQTTLRSIGHIAKLQSIKDNDEALVAPLDMLRELEQDNKSFAAAQRKAHGLCDDNGDVASASLLEVWIDETEAANLVSFRSDAQRRRHGALNTRSASIGRVTEADSQIILGGTSAETDRCLACSPDWSCRRRSPRRWRSPVAACTARAGWSPPTTTSPCASSAMSATTSPSTSPRFWTRSAGRR